MQFTMKSMVSAVIRLGYTLRVQRSGCPGAGGSQWASVFKFAAASSGRIIAYASRALVGDCDSRDNEHQCETLP